ncbi:MAG: N-acetylglucosamine-6-phosphate deacetylase [Acidobacteriota bacterium]
MTEVSASTLLLAGGHLVLPDRIVEQGSLLVEGGLITALHAGRLDPPAGATRIDLDGAFVLPGFIDVHVHGVEGHDVLDGHGAVAAVAARLPRYGVTAFCPTSLACAPARLMQMLAEVATLRASPTPMAARVLPAHLESNFINPEYRGAQPLECLRLPPQARRAPAADTKRSTAGRDDSAPRPSPGPGDGSSPTGRQHFRAEDHAAGFTAQDVLEVLSAHRPSVGIVTVAPELDGGLELVRTLAEAGHRVSIGHTGATYEETLAAIECGVSHATHLFNRMSAMTHRSPGTPGAILASEAVCAEVICDGFHVHPALISLAIRAKGTRGILAITDATAGAGLPVGSRTHLGGRAIVVTDSTAELPDGTWAGSVTTMDRVFGTLVHIAGVSIQDATRLCATTPADQLGRADIGRLAVGAAADLVVLDRHLHVVTTYLAGQAWRNPAAARAV